MVKWLVSSEGLRSSESILFWFQVGSIPCLHHTGLVVVQEFVLLCPYIQQQMICYYPQPSLPYYIAFVAQNHVRKSDSPHQKLLQYMISINYDWSRM